jgi:hypothetical protein
MYQVMSTTEKSPTKSDFGEGEAAVLNPDAQIRRSVILSTISPSIGHHSPAIGSTISELDDTSTPQLLSELPGSPPSSGDSIRRDIMSYYAARPSPNPEHSQFVGGYQPYRPA